MRSRSTFAPSVRIKQTKVNLIVASHRRNGCVCVERFKVRDCGKKLCLNWSIQRPGDWKTESFPELCLHQVRVLEPNVFNFSPLCKDAAVLCVSSHCFCCCHGYLKASASSFLPAEFKRSIIRKCPSVCSALLTFKSMKHTSLLLPATDNVISDKTHIPGDSSAPLCAVEGTAV